MDDFPEFMKNSRNAIAPENQSTSVKGWVYDGIDSSQMAYWLCENDGLSNEHTHDYDEYIAVLQGEYVVIIDQKRICLRKGDEYFIPKTAPHAGEFIKGTRTIHCFGGKRANRIE